MEVRQPDTLHAAPSGWFGASDIPGPALPDAGSDLDIVIPLYNE